MPGSWSSTPAVPVSGAVISAAGWGKKVAEAISDLQASWLGPFADATARDAAVPSPVDGNACYLQDVDQLSVRRNGAWVPVVVGDTSWADLAAGTASLRTLGPGAQQAAAGNHSHAGGTSWYVEKASDTTRTSTSITADPDLAVAIGASGTYLVDAWVKATLATSGGNPTYMKWDLGYSGSASSTGMLSALGWDYGTTGVKTGTQADPLASPGPINFGTVGTYVMHVHARLKATSSGTLSFRWACVNASYAVTADAGSHMNVQQVA